MGKLIDENNLRMSRNDGVEIHLGERLSFIFDMAAGDDFKPA